MTSDHEHEAPQQDRPYEPPSVEDLDASDSPAVTAAGNSVPK
jgi:hypothetical protein